MRVLIVGNSPSHVNLDLIENYECVIALDGMANILSANNVKYNFVVGDMDSIDLNDEKIDASNIISISDQDTSDLEKAINFCGILPATSIDIINALGGEQGHTLYNIRSLKRYYDKKRIIRIIHNSQILQYYESGELILEGNVGEKVDILSAHKAIVFSEGLVYDMDNLLLEYGGKDSISNAFKANKVTINLKGGVVLIRELNNFSYSNYIPAHPLYGKKGGLSSHSKF